MPVEPDNDRRLQDVADALRGRLGEAVLLHLSLAKDGLIVKLRPAGLRDALLFLKEDQGFNALLDIIALDRLKRGSAGPGPASPRFEVLYQLYRFPAGLRIRLSVEAMEGEEIASAQPIYKSADWAEREAYDMFGIRFAGHPCLRRIYLPDDFEGFPLRKDFPLEGTKRGL
jgi:NADH-quinone oxidoreductase subunit C